MAGVLRGKQNSPVANWEICAGLAKCRDQRNFVGPDFFFQFILKLDVPMPRFWSHRSSLGSRKAI
jgi:hypothetical protein